MIKKYIDFVNEEMEETIPSVTKGEVDEDPMVCVKITKEEEDLFNTEPVLQDLVDQRKITYQSGEMCYPKDDQAVIDVIKIYFDSVTVNESRRLNEMMEDDDLTSQRGVDSYRDGTHPMSFTGHQDPSKWAPNTDHSYHIRRDTQLAKDAFEAGEKYAAACESPNREECNSAEDFETWWHNYKK